MTFDAEYNAVKTDALLYGSGFLQFDNTHQGIVCKHVDSRLVSIKGETDQPRKIKFEFSDADLVDIAELKAQGFKFHTVTMMHADGHSREIEIVAYEAP